MNRPCRAARSCALGALLLVGLLPPCTGTAPAGRAYPGYDHVISLKPGGRVDFDGSSLAPGAVVAVEGEGAQLILRGLRGTAERPITIINHGGRVRIGSREGDALRLSGCAHIELRGDGDPAVRYGFELFRAGEQGLHITDRSTDVAVSWVEIHHAGFAGMMAKSDPSWRRDTPAGGEPGPSNRGRFVQRNTRIHHTLIYDCPGEGMYVGHSFYSGIHERRDNPATPLLFPHELHGVSIAHNHVVRCGREGIQVGAATRDVSIHHNVIYDCGRSGILAQSNGVQLGEGTSGHFYANTIVRARANGLILLGAGHSVVEENVIADAGENAIFVDSRPDTRGGSGYQIRDNTLLGARGHGLLIFDTHQKQMRSTFSENRVVLSPGSEAVSRHDREGRFQGADVAVSKNTIVPAVQSVNHPPAVP